jgi:uncharacterized protein DUF2877
MNLVAISMGYAVPDGNFDASVHSAFQSAINVRLNNEDRLLTLVASKEGDLPQGIRLDTPEAFSFEEFQIGEPAANRDGILHFENTSLTIQLHGARRWKCNLSALEFDPTNPAVAAAWSFVWGALNKRQRISESEIIAEDLFRSSGSAQAGVAGKVGEAMRALIHATRHYEFADISAVKSLVGLGSGLTPAGDDLLVGYMAGLWCTVRDETGRVQFVSSLGNVILHLSRLTNDISRTYLYHGVRGQVSSRLANLAETICHGGNSEHLPDIAETAMRVGHTSGMDVVTGLLMGLTAWQGDDLFST